MNHLHLNLKRLINTKVCFCCHTDYFLNSGSKRVPSPVETSASFKDCLLICIQKTQNKMIDVKRGLAVHLK